MTRICRSVVPLVIIALLLPKLGAAQSMTRSSPSFEISFPASAHGAPITGRVYVALSRTYDGRRTPIDQTGENGVPLFALNVSQLALVSRW